MKRRDFLRTLIAAALGWLWPGKVAATSWPDVCPDGVRFCYAHEAFPPKSINWSGARKRARELMEQAKRGHCCLPYRVDENAGAYKWQINEPPHRKVKT